MTVVGRGRAALRAVAELETFDADEIWEQMIRQVREAEGGVGDITIYCRRGWTSSPPSTGTAPSTVSASPPCTWTRSWPSPSPSRMTWRATTWVTLDLVRHHDTTAGVQVDLAMWNISIHGVEAVRLQQLVLERGEALDSLRERAVINLGNISVRGMYQYTAECTNWFCIVNSFDSEVRSR